METTIHAFRADTIFEAACHVARMENVGRHVDTATLDTWRTYAAAAHDRDFPYTELLWSTIIERAVLPFPPSNQPVVSPAMITEHLVSDWRRCGLEREQAWQALWLV